MLSVRSTKQSEEIMITTKYGIKIECKRRSGKIQLRVWSRDPVRGFNHCYTISEMDADALISEIIASKQ